MRRDQILSVLREHQPELESHGVSSLALFGSVARDEAGSESDVDILVEFDRPVGLFEFVRLQMRLEVLLGLPVDLVTPDALRQTMRDRILGEAVYAA
jgi:predicted nucleotidyltransferase